MKLISPAIFSRLCLMALLVSGCSQQANDSVADDATGTAAVKVEIINEDGKYRLLRAGQPYQIKGAGIEYGDIAAFAAHGGNSFRTWRPDNDLHTGQQVLDMAHAQGLTVALCLEIARERHGFDYDDPEAVAKQFEEARQQVLKYRDHPALLAWIIGNELNLGYENPRVYDAVNEIALMIHELDPNHPATTTIAGFSKELADVINERAPAIDFLSIQMYGELMKLPDYIEQAGFTRPYAITEWGAVGHWEVQQTAWGAPIEQTSSEKAQNYLASYEKVIKPFPDQIVGDYVFLWGQKQERTPTWYGMFTETGEETEAVDVMHYIWNGAWPANRTPRLDSMLLDDKMAAESIRLAPGEEYGASVVVKDYENDPLRYLWEVKAETKATAEGGDHEAAIPSLPGLIDDPGQANIQLTAPAVPGAYRLFVYAYDGQGHAAHANIPFLVSEGAR